jgi:large subunit ribosomal protein L29
MMKISELRTKEKSELYKDLKALSKEWFKLRLQRKLGEEPRAHNFKILRRDIARIKTVINEKR